MKPDCLIEKHQKDISKLTDLQFFLGFKSPREQTKLFEFLPSIGCYTKSERSQDIKSGFFRSNAD